MSTVETVRIDLSACRDKAALMEAFAAGLRLPAHFGRNWDALYDLLREHPERRVEVSGWNALRRAAPAEAAMLDALREDLTDSGAPVLLDLDRNGD
jgi:RNAse (barnase) inhibitor barstar